MVSVRCFFWGGGMLMDSNPLESARPNFSCVNALEKQVLKFRWLGCKEGMRIGAAEHALPVRSKTNTCSQHEPCKEFELQRSPWPPNRDSHPQPIWLAKKVWYAELDECSPDMVHFHLQESRPSCSS